MWLFARGGRFASIVQDRTDPNILLVRGRFAGDVEAVLGLKRGDKRVSTTVDADYRFRAHATRAEVAARLVELVDGLDYANFKNTAAPDRHGVLMDVWTTMFREQTRRHPVRRPSMRLGYRDPAFWRDEPDSTWDDDPMPWNRVSAYDPPRPPRRKKRRGKKRAADPEAWAGLPLTGGSNPRPVAVAMPDALYDDGVDWPARRA